MCYHVHCHLTSQYHVMAFAIVLCCNSRGLICRAVCVGTCLDAAHTSRWTSTKKLPGEHTELGCPIATWARSPQRFCACPACQSWTWANEEIVSWVERLPASTLQVWWGQLLGRCRVACHFERAVCEARPRGAVLVIMRLKPSSYV